LRLVGNRFLWGDIVLAMHLDGRRWVVALIHDPKAEIVVSMMVKILAVNNRVQLPRDMQVALAMQGMKPVV